MKPIIEVKKISKKYQIGTTSDSYTTLRDVIIKKICNILSFSRTKNTKNSFLALDNISFSVNPGEIIGIIGPNGAGKSTLLKIITQITPPSQGEIIIRGKVASLLEIGTGFHPELTGRENIFLNGAILGMSRGEIKTKLNDIVDFSGVEKFINTPVKHYSSGMKVRLAFAVAAHLESDILLVDEVLAVGDDEFQKKSLGKMEDISKLGRTVLFVSHNMAIVSRLCQRGILLKKGKIIIDDKIENTISEYLKMDRDTPAEKKWSLKSAPGDDTARLLSVKVKNSKSKISHNIPIDQPFSIEMEYQVLKDQARLFTDFGFFNNQGTFLFLSPKWSKSPQIKGTYKAICNVPGNLFSDGMIRVVAEIGTQSPFYIKHVLEYDAVSFQIIDRGGGNTVRGDWGNNLPGVMRPKLDWQQSRLK